MNQLCSFYSYVLRTEGKFHFPIRHFHELLLHAHLHIFSCRSLYSFYNIRVGDLLQNTVLQASDVHRLHLTLQAQKYKVETIPKARMQG